MEFLSGSFLVAVRTVHRFSRDERQGAQRIRARRDLSLRPHYRRQRTRPHHPHPDRRSHGSRGSANDYARRSATGHHHARQRHDQSERRRLLQSHRSQSRDRRSRELPSWRLRNSLRPLLRSVIGQVEMDELLAARDTVNHKLQTILDSQTENWGVKVSNVEVKQIDLPAEMQRAMARQAEAERDRRAKVIAAEANFKLRRNFPKPPSHGKKPGDPSTSLSCRPCPRSRARRARPSSIPLPMDLLKPFLKNTRHCYFDAEAAAHLCHSTSRYRLFSARVRSAAAVDASGPSLLRAITLQLTLYAPSENCRFESRPDSSCRDPSSSP